MDEQALTHERGDRKKSERLAVLTLVAVFLFNVYRFLNIQLGWQQRDWAKLDAEELDELYGVRRRIAPRRGAFWAVIASLLLTVAGVGWTLRARSPAPITGVGITPSALYGMDIPGGSSLGPPGVCQELELADGAWRCDTIAVNTANVPVIRATPYSGPCTHLQVVGTRWACLGVG